MELGGEGAIVYAIAIIRYRRPLEDVLKHSDAHRAYLKDLKAKGIVVASGPLDPRYGGAIVLRVPDQGFDAALLAIRDGDPYTKAGVAQYELLGWNVQTGKEDLDRIGKA
jgi:uncharacterized protein YciI